MQKPVYCWNGWCYLLEIYKSKSISKFLKIFEEYVLITKITSNMKGNTSVLYIIAETIYAIIPPRDETVNCVKPNFASSIVQPFLHFFTWMECAALEPDFQSSKNWTS